MRISAEAQQVLVNACSAGTIPGAAAMTGDGEASREAFACGVRQQDGPMMTSDTRFDLASLTKVVATLPGILLLASAGELELDQSLRRWFSSAGWFKEPSLGDVTVRQLLSHDGGLSAWSGIFTTTRDRLTALAAALQSEVRTPGGPALYSDLGFMLLGALIERISGQRLDAFTNEHIFAPLGMTATGFIPLGPDGRPENPQPDVAYAATEYCGWRNRLLSGEVHDENCFAWQGVAGHAGLFGTAGDLGRYARAWLNLDSRLGRSELLLEAQREQARTASGEPRGLGWALAHPDSFAGAKTGGYGHTGFTGTSLWLDPSADLFAVLLTNRVHPDRHNTPSITGLRRAFHEAVWQENDVAA
jgi:CubicO group peptidase (beta-lactamase class C family)